MEKKQPFVPSTWSDWITVVGAHEHNLKHITAKIPKNCLTVITGPSGSGKSSLALDVLYTEGKRRYMESLSSYARQFLGIAKKPLFDRIDGLCPAIAIEQKTVGSNPRSTVGTITEIYDYLRVLFARIGHLHCPECAMPISVESPESITHMIINKFKHQTITIAAPIVERKKGEFLWELLSLFDSGLYRFIIDGTHYKFKSQDEIHALKLKKSVPHTIDALIDSLEVSDSERSRIFEAIEKAFTFARGMCRIIVGEKKYIYSSSRMCVQCATSIADIEPRLFSFNSPIGACPECQGLGTLSAWSWHDGGSTSYKSEYETSYIDRYAIHFTCDTCNGKRLNPMALAVTIGNKDIIELSSLSIKQLRSFFASTQFSEKEFEIAAALLKEIDNRLQFLIDVGLGYLTLNRPARTLSGGEGQRIRLATQIGSALSGVLYVLDEPSIGLHQRDNDRLIDTLKSLRDQGNTVVVVEHDIDTMREADYIIDMGPAAGSLGGEITAYGTPEQLAQNPDSLTGAYLSGKREIKVPRTLRKAKGYMTLKNATTHNLKNVTVDIPLGVLCGISGVSGSGKSSLIMHELVPQVRQALARKKISGPSETLSGTETLENMVVIDQSPIGRTPRSNPATYLGIFDEIRTLFAQLPESVARGYKSGRFSFNVSDGRCAECNGDGTITVEMHFLPEVVMTCKTCNGKRYNSETLQILYKGKNIADILALTALQALELFAHHKRLAKTLQLLCEVGLDYIQLGQPSTTLSGGEAQRIKLVGELAKRGADTLYILDEPTTGLHSNDIEKLLGVLNRLVDKGNSMIVIEHNLDVLKTVDYLIDLGPEGGDEGGMIVAYGTPRKVAQSHKSHTGRYLAHYF
ncbi:MAG TPA: excinuclease ABC subunit UvrA [Candidatus Babeliales bacterium]|nr:excinuclease ABC subunit UvrA [Candidatus Babeliales bacterium]